MNDRQIATVLAALRERQARLIEQDNLPQNRAADCSKPQFDEIATNLDSFDALSIEEIDELCEGLNP